MLSFIIIFSFISPVATAESVNIAASDIANGKGGSEIYLGVDGTGEHKAALKFEGIDELRTIESAYLQITGEEGNNNQVISVSVAGSDDWVSTGALPGVDSSKVITQSLGAPIQTNEEYGLATYSIDVAELLSNSSNIGADGIISFVLSSNHESVNWFLHEDTYGPIPHLVIEYAPLDTEPPVYTGGSPTVTDTTTTSTTLSVQLDEPGTVYYVMQVGEALAPSAAQVMLGMQSDGTPALLFGSFIVDTVGIDVDVLITGLSGNTDYDLYVVAEDGLGNLQSTVTKLNVRTLNSAPTDISLSSTTVGQAAGIDAEVGILTTIDADPADSHMYELVSGAGDQHNNGFNIAGSQLRINNAMGMSPGPYSIRIRTSDEAGAMYERTFTITLVDDVAPAAPIIITPVNETVTTNKRPIISGRAEAGSTVEVFINGVSLGTTPADGTENWSYTPTSEWLDELYRITATAKDGAGNTSVVSVAVTVTIDTTAPDAPIVMSPSAGTVTSVTTPTISGTAEANSSVEVFREGTSQGTVTADGSGNWSYTPASEWSEGLHRITAHATDAVGNVSIESAVVTVTIDITEPNAPIITSPNHGTLTTDSKLSISGTAEAGSIVELFIGGVSHGTTSADKTERWMYTPASDWSDGVHSITARATDAAGNTSAASTTVTMTIDTIAPSAPIVTNPSDGAIISDTTPTIRGTSEANSTVEVLRGGVSQGTTSADESGNWTYTAASNWSEATHSITVRATDAAGNTSPDSTEVAVTIDITAPNAPIILSPVDGTLSANPLLIITGTSEADSTVEVFRGGLSQGTTQADGSGNWTYTPANNWGDGTYSLTANTTDKAGNTSVASTVVTVTIDSTAPSAPIIISPLDGTMSSDVTPTITGTAEAGSSVEIFREGISLGSATADGGGDWAYTPSSNWSDGTYRITAKATDTAGNTSIDSTTVAVTIDTIAPSAPIITSPADGTLSTDKTPVISGTAEASSTVEVFRGGVSQGTTDVDGTGNWTYTTASNWSEGTHSITASATDAAGNTSVSSTEVTVTIDATAPSAPIIMSPLDRSSTSDATPTISGTAEAASSVEVFRGDESIESVTADGSGNWTYTPAIDWAEATHSIIATATDRAGNTSAASSAVSVTIDITAPGAPIITSPIDGAISSDATPVIRGTAEEGSTVEIIRSGESQGTTTADGSGNWTYTAASDWSEGTYTVTARAMDAAENTSVDSTAVAVMIDLTAPSAPIITSPLDGTLSANAIPTITGTAEADSMVEVFSDDVSQGTSTVDGMGNWTYTPASRWSEGTHSITASATDVAGNTSTASTAVAFTIDTIAPSVPVITSPSDGSFTSDASPTISGTAEVGSTIEVLREGVSIGAVATDGSGNWAYTPASNWSEGTHSITAKATDAAGNMSIDSMAVSVTIDTIAPSAPIITSPLNGAISSGAAPTINGTSEASSMIEVFRSGVSLGKVAADESGSWTYTPASTWSEGTHSITANATDAAGNTSNDSAAVSITIDTTAPNTPVITNLSDGMLSADVKLAFSGTAEASSKVEIFMAAVLLGTTTADGSGNWSYTPTSDWADGVYSITLRATDAVGNTSADSAAIEFIIDTGSPVITLKGDTNKRIEVGTAYEDEGAVAADTRQGDLSSSIIVTNQVDVNVIGTYTVNYTVSDGAGNEAIAVQRTVTVIPPVVTVSGSSGSRTIAVSNAIPGATLTLYNDKQLPVGELGTADGEGAFVFKGVEVGQGYYVTQSINGIVSNPSLLITITRPNTSTPPVSEEKVRQGAPIIIDGKDSGVQVDIVRSINSAGKVVNKVVLDLDKIKSIVESALKQGSTMVRILINDIPNEPADEVTVAIDHTSVQQLISNGITFEIRTSNATIRLTQEVLQQSEQQDIDLQFRLAPIRNAADIQKIAARLVTSELVQAVLGAGKVEAVGTPLVVEAKFKNNSTSVILPLPGIEQSHNDSNSKQSESSYAVYIEHRDGEKSVQRGNMVYDANERPIGIEIEVSEDSTVTVFRFSDEMKHTPYVSGYSDGTFAPNRTVTRAELAAMLSRLLKNEQLGSNANSTQYSDVAATHWSARYLADVQQLGLMGGYSDGTFRPDKPVTRAEFAKAVVRLLDGKRGDRAYSVNDIDGHWAYESIISILENGAMKGYSDGSFRPNEGLTRAEAVSALNRIFGRQPLTGMDSPYTDIHSEHWAYGDIMEASVEHSESQHTE